MRLIILSKDFCQGKNKKEAHFDKVTVHRKFRRGKKRHKRRQSKLNFISSELKLIIYKMRIPFLILCLAVVYGTCRTFEHEKNFDLSEELQNNGDYKLNHVPLERALLSRHRRASLLAPVTFPIKAVLNLLGYDNGVISQITDLIKFISAALIGEVECPKVEFSLGLIPKTIINPVETIKVVGCYIIQEIGSQTRVILRKVIDIFIQLIRNVFLPGLHTTLNTLDGTGLLPSQISTIIKVFNTIYSLLQIIGYVP